jgi:hypothetical protein
MANPNLVGSTTIRRVGTVATLGTSYADILANGGSSNALYVITNVLLANKDTSDRTVSIQVYRSSTGYQLCKDVTIPVGGTVRLVTRDAPVYLNEGDSLRGLASAGSAIDVIVSHEQVS